MSAFQKLPSTRKGSIAEQYVVDLLSTRGWHVYRYAQDTSHPIDLLAITERRELVAVEVKCKPARVYYPDTGMDYNDYLAYHKLSADLGIPVLVLFVDYESCRVMGNYLDKLSEPIVVVDNGRELVYPWVVDKYVYCPLCVLEIWAEIPLAIAQQIARCGYTGTKYRQPLPARVPLDKSVSDRVEYEYGWLDVDQPKPNDGG